MRGSFISLSNVDPKASGFCWSDSSRMERNVSASCLDSRLTIKEDSLMIENVLYAGSWTNESIFWLFSQPSAPLIPLSQTSPMLPADVLIAPATRFERLCPSSWRTPGLNGPAGLALSGNDLFVGNQSATTVGENDASTGAAINASFITGLTNPSGLAVASVPEPSTWSMIAVAGVALLGIMLRKNTVSHRNWVLGSNGTVMERVP